MEKIQKHTREQHDHICGTTNKIQENGDLWEGKDRSERDSQDIENNDNVFCVLTVGGEHRKSVDCIPTLYSLHAFYKCYFVSTQH